MIDEQLFDTAIEELIETHVRITNLETITQALADELMAQDDYIHDLLWEYRHTLDMLDDRHWKQTQEDAYNAGNP